MSDSCNSRSPRQLRPYQVGAGEWLRHSFGTLQRLVVLRAPKAFGKSVATANIVRRALTKVERVLLIVPRHVVDNQAEAGFWREGICPTKIIQGSIPRGNPSAQIHVASTLFLARGTVAEELVPVPVYDSATTASEILHGHNIGLKRRINRGAHGPLIVDLEGTKIRLWLVICIVHDRLNIGARSKTKRNQSSYALPRSCNACRARHTVGFFPACDQAHHTKTSKIKAVPWSSIHLAWEHAAATKAVSKLWLSSVSAVADYSGRSWGWESHASRNEFGNWAMGLTEVRGRIPQDVRTLDHAKEKALHKARNRGGA